MEQTKLLNEFRPIGAVGNNLQNPDLNPVVGAPEATIAAPNFEPGTVREPVSDLPNARTISNDVVGATSSDGQSAETPDQTGASAMLYAFGQFVDHDLSLEGTGKEAIDIPVPSGDPEFADNSSIAMNRVVTDPTTGTIKNNVAGFLDLSQVYGSDAAKAASLRNADGTMATSPGDALPIVNAAPPPGTPGDGIAAPTFVSGDSRVSEQPELTALTTAFVREHNWWVGILKQTNPDWTGDQLYNMAKAITTAEYQNITYKEFLPSLIGPSALGNYAGYNPSVNPQVTQEFSTSAFRVGHTQVSDEQAQLNNQGDKTSVQSLSQSFFDTPAQVEANDGINALLRNLSNETSQAVDVYAVDGLRNLLATDPDKMDLIAIDIQRERDVGIASLNDTRVALGLDPYSSFDQITGDPTVQANLASTFGDINKVDLFVGGIAEDHADGSDVGPTFQAIIADQFTALRAGDRFWWQNENFDPKLKTMIGNTTFADVLQRTTQTPAEQQNLFVAAQRHMSNTPAKDPEHPQLVVGSDDAGAQVAGGPADDTIVAGLGMDQIMTGGGGANVFIYNGPNHAGSISDFDPRQDKISIQPAADDMSMNPMLSSDPAVTVSMADFQGDAVLGFNGNTVTLTGVPSSALSASNFLMPNGAWADLTHATT
jgi:peroxidase